MAHDDNLQILVTGGTGTQGGGVARALLATKHRVRVLTRDPSSPAAVALEKQGAELVRGDMNDPPSLKAALQGVHGVFSVQRPDADGSDSERRHGFALIDAAREAGVRHFVHSSVCQVDQHTRFPRWESGYWSQKYWTDKWQVEQRVREAGFPHWTVLRPSFIMENFAQPKVSVLFPQLRHGQLLTPVLPQSRVQLICGDDMGAFARAAFDSAGRFDRKVIELASDDLTMEQVAAVLGQQLGKRVTLKSVTPDEALQAGIFPTWVRSQEWINDVGYRIDMASARSYGVPMTSFADWVKRHAERIPIDS